MYKMNWNQEQFYLNEIILAKSILEKRPNDTQQQERLVQGAAYLGKFELAEQYCTTEKSRATIDKYKLEINGGR